MTTWLRARHDEPSSASGRVLRLERESGCDAGRVMPTRVQLIFLRGAKQPLEAQGKSKPCAQHRTSELDPRAEESECSGQVSVHTHAGETCNSLAPVEEVRCRGLVVCVCLSDGWWW